MPWPLAASRSLCKAAISARISSVLGPASSIPSACDMCDICELSEPLLAPSILCLKYSPLVLEALGDDIGASMLFRLDARRRGGGGGGSVD